MYRVFTETVGRRLHKAWHDVPDVLKFIIAAYILVLLLA